MNFFGNFLKGILMGIGNIAPGVSGGALAIILGVYEGMVHAVGHFFKDIKKNILFLLPIGLGVVVGTIAFGDIIKYLLSHYLMPTSFTFAGLITGTLPLLFRSANKKGFKKTHFIPLVITLVFALSLVLVEGGFNTEGLKTSIEITPINMVLMVFYGFLLAGSSVIPGISGSVLMMLLGIYGVLLEVLTSYRVIISALTSNQNSSEIYDIIFYNVAILAPLAIGFGIGVLFFSKLMDYLLKSYHAVTYYAIIGFVIGSIAAFFPGFSFDLTGFTSIVCFATGLFISYSISKLDKN